MESARKLRRSSLMQACLEALESRQLLSTTIYVSPSGSDSSGNGSFGSPYKTLEFAAGHLAAGTTLIAEAGTYGGFALGLGNDNPVTGTAANPVLIEADPNAAPGSVLINTHWTSGSSSGVDGIRLEGTGNQYITIKGFTITNDGTITSAGIHDDNGNNVTIEYNTITGMHEWGILTGFVSNSLFLDNICNNSQIQHGIYVGNTCSYDTIQGNTCANNAGCGIHMNGDSSEGGNGNTQYNLIIDNLIYNNGAPGGGSGLDCDGIQYSTIEDNLFYNNHASGMSLYTGDADGTLGGSFNNLVANNTFVTATDGRFAINIGSSGNSSTTSRASTGNIIFNNIILGRDSNLHGAIEIDSLALPGTVFDYNVYAGSFSNDGANNNFLTLAQWQSATGLDTHSVTSTASAVFVSPGSPNYNYQLKAGSPAIDFGVASLSGKSAPTVDIIGTSRPQGSAFDAGAYEYIPPANSTVTGRVFQDNNADGTFNGADAGLNGKTVYLDENNNNVMDSGEPSTATNASGNYTFTGLASGLSGTVRLTSQPTGFVLDNLSANGFATSGSTSTVNLGYFPTAYTGVSGNDNYTLQLDGGGSNINVLIGATLTYSAPKTLASSLSFNLSAGVGSLTVNEANGNPIQTGGITVTGGASADSLTVSGLSGNNAITVNGSQVGVNSSTINYSSLAAIAVNTGSGNDSLTQSAQPGNSASLAFNNGTGNDSLIVTGGSFAIPSNPTGNLSVTAGGGGGAASVSFAGDASAVHGIDAYSLASLTVSNNGTATLIAPVSGLTADRTLLTTNALSVSGTGSVNLTANSIDVHYGGGSDPFSTIRGNVISGKITSSLDDSAHAVGYADGADGVINTISSGDIVLRFTTMGDANLDGTTSFVDLVKVAQNYNATASNWDTGDFNGDGTTNFADLVKVAQNYNASLSAKQFAAARAAAKFVKALAKVHL